MDLWEKDNEILSNDGDSNNDEDIDAELSEGN